MNALNPGLSPALQRLGEVSVRLSVELGRTDMPLRDVLALGEGSVVSLDRLTDELLEITANGQVIAFGEVIAQDGKFALRIVSLAGGDAPASGPPPRPRQSASPRPDAPVAGPSAGPVADSVADPVADETHQPENAAQPEASAPVEDTDIDELAAALDDTLAEAPAEAPASGDASVQEPEDDPLADALADLPEAPNDAAPNDTASGQGTGE